MCPPDDEYKSALFEELAHHVHNMRHTLAVLEKECRPSEVAGVSAALDALARILVRTTFALTGTHAADFADAKARESR
jgi:hypothetical protein